jgi:hypothetical protein
MRPLGVENEKVEVLAFEMDMICSSAQRERSTTGNIVHEYTYN